PYQSKWKERELRWMSRRSHSVDTKDHREVPKVQAIAALTEPNRHPHRRPELAPYGASAIQDGGNGENADEEVEPREPDPMRVHAGALHFTQQDQARNQEGGQHQDAGPAQGCCCPPAEATVEHRPARG